MSALNNEQDFDRRGCLFFANRIGWPALAILGSLAQMVNKSGVANSEWMGPLTHHVGDTSWGASSALIAGYIWMLSESIELKESQARFLGLAAMTFTFSLIVGSELTESFGNTPDLLDLPAAFVGLIAGACLVEIMKPNTRSKVID